MSPRHSTAKFRQELQMLFPQKRETFSETLIPFFLSTHNSRPFEKKDQLHSINISEVIDLTNVVTSMTESSCFKKPFEILHVHGSQTLLKPALQHFYPNFPLIQKKLSWKTSLFFRSEILGLFGNTLTANYMYSRHGSEKFMQ